MLKRLITVCVLVLAQVLFIPGARAQWNVMFPASPQANGRAGTYLNAEDTDPLAPLSNPGLLGLMARQNQFMLAFYPQRTNGIPLGYWGKFELSSRAVYVGLNQDYFHWKLPLSVGFGYHETNMTFANFFEDMGYSGSVHPRANSKGFSLGLGLAYPHLEAGVGYNQKFASMGWDGNITVNTADFGIFVQAPFDIALRRSLLSTNQMPDGVQPFITPCFGYALLNVGGRDKPYGERPERTAKLSLAVTAGMHATHPAGSDWRLLSLEAGVEGEDLLIKSIGNDVHYQGALGDIDPIRDLLLGQSNAQITKRAGYELGLGEIGCLRWGTYLVNHAGYSVYYSDRYTTTGFGLRLAGVMKLVTLSPAMRANRAVAFVARRLDVQYDVSSVSRQISQETFSIYPYDLDVHHTYHELSVIFKY